MLYKIYIQCAVQNTLFQAAKYLGISDMVEFFEKLKPTLPERKFNCIITNLAQINYFFI